MVTPYVDGDKASFKTKKSFYSDVAIMATEFAQTILHAWSGIYERVVDLLKSHTLKNWSLRSVANTNFSQEG